MSTRPLRLITDDGEVIDFQTVQKLRDELTGAQHTIRSQAWTIGELTRNRELDAQASQHWPKAIELFDLWRDLCHHPRSDFTADRFWACEPFLRRKAYGEHRCWAAIHGAAYDAKRRRRRNGTWERFDAWWLPGGFGIFGGADSFEGFVNKAPAEIKAELAQRLEVPVQRVRLPLPRPEMNLSLGEQAKLV